MSFTTEEQGLRSLEIMCEQVGGTGPVALTPRGAACLEAAIRTCYLAIALGATAERAAAPAPPEQVCHPISGDTDFFSAMTTAFMEGLLGAAADLDPLDRGPAHLALPSVVAASIAAEITGRHDAIEAAVLQGMEVGGRLRRAVTGPRPGSGFHSAGTFGTFAAAAAAAKIFRLSPERTARAIAIAFSRAAGLALNSAATWVGLSHFGWAAAHGLEAGWLAANDFGASTDVETALHTFFPQAEVDLSAVVEPAGPQIEELIFFKQYPCNIYLNLVVMALVELREPVDHITVTLPLVRHLDNPSPSDVRAARNSAQAVAAIAALHPHTYSSFMEKQLDFSASSALLSVMRNIDVKLDSGRSPRIDEVTVEVDVRSGGRRRSSREVPGTALVPWGVEHAQRLAQGLAVEPLVSDLFGDNAAHAHRIVIDLMLRKPALEVGHES